MGRQVLAGAGRLTGRVPRWLVTVLGATLVLLGLVLAVRPFRSLAVLVVLLVAALLLSGLGDLARGHRPWGPLRGLVQLLAALSLLLRPGAGLAVLTLVVGVALLVDGLLGLAEGVRSTGPERWAASLTGVALAVVGTLALAWRDVALLVVAVAFGVRLVMLGSHLVRRGRRTPGTAPGSASPRRRVARAALAAAGALALAAVGVLVQLGHPRPDPFYSTPAHVPPQPGRLLAAEPFDTGVPDGADGWRILYTTTRDDGIPAVASGVVVTPREQPGPSPVIAWAHGTTGWAPGCAPSLLDEPFEAGALFVLDEMLARGWTVVATDYVGLGTEGPHPYVIGQGQARSELDSVRSGRCSPSTSSRPTPPPIRTSATRTTSVRGCSCWRGRWRSAACPSVACSCRWASPCCSTGRSGTGTPPPDPSAPASRRTSRPDASRPRCSWRREQRTASSPRPRRRPTWPTGAPRASRWTTGPTPAGTTSRSSQPTRRPWRSCSTGPRVDTRTIVITARFAAPPERVWALYADPRQLERVWGPPQFPATFVEHKLAPGGRMTYYMTSPEGQRFGGWWEITEVDEPRSFSFRDGFADADLRPLPDMPVSQNTYSFEAVGGGTRAVFTSVYATAEGLEQVLAMGVEEGATSAINQIDDHLAAAAQPESA